MNSVKVWLAAGTDQIRREDGCWRVEQIGPPLSAAFRPNTALPRGRALLLWLDLLRDRPGVPSYRIRPAAADK